VNKTTTCLFLLAAAMLLTGCESPLNKAALAGNTAKIQQLLDNGADINKRTLAYSRTPLLYAAETGNTNVVELLLSKGVQTSMRSDAMGYTALDVEATVRGPMPNA
jgi:ankyrin repeat protein